MKYITITRKRERERLCTDVLQVSINSLNSTKVLAHVHLCNTLVEQNLLKKIASEHRVPRILHHWVPKPSPSDAKVLHPRNLKTSFHIQLLWIRCGHVSSACSLHLCHSLIQGWSQSHQPMQLRKAQRW